MEFGKKLKQILKEKSITQKKFAQDCDLHEGYTSRVLNGESPSADFIIKTASYFRDIDLYHLLIDEPEQEFVSEPGKGYEKEANPIKIIDEIEYKLKDLKQLVSQK